MRLISGNFFVVLFALSFTGCARFPTTQEANGTPTRTFYSEMTVNDRGSINADYYYFLSFGVDQSDLTGPVPVITGPELTNGWGTITGLPNNEVQQPPFYVMVHGGSFAQYRGSTYLGPPFRHGVSENNRTVWVEIDQGLLDPLLTSITNPIVQFNWITMETLIAPIDPIAGTKQYDAFGSTGNSYFHPVPTTVSGIFTSGTLQGSPNYEPIYGLEESTTSDPDIDIASWRFEVRLR